MTNGKFEVTSVETTERKNSFGRVEEVFHHVKVRQTAVCAGRPADLPPAPSKLVDGGTEYEEIEK